jgi:hypothetical protein
LEFIQLDRQFLPIKKDEEIDTSIGSFWGPRFGGWLDWQDLFKKRRVRPDLTLSATTVQFEVAIEIKQADSCTANELPDALTIQLAEDYLKPQSRRHGILFLTDHGRKKWKHPKTKQKLSFDEIVQWLNKTASQMKCNSSGQIEISAFGITCV